MGREVYPAERNLRATAVVVPKGDAPPGGWPFVLYFEFMYPNGRPQNWPGLKDLFRNPPGGLLDMDLSPFLTEDWFDVNGLYRMQEALHGIVNSGYALVMTSQYSDDNMFYNPPYKCSAKDSDNGCWNGGDNPDAAYLKLVFDLIRENTLIPNVKLDYTRMGIMGYSVGAQMVSRSMNDFPDMQTLKNRAFPPIKAAIMIGGGSFHCYSHDYDKESAMPPNYLPCANFEMGCCPHNETEPKYDHGERPWSEHPPTLLLQTRGASFAAPHASSYYFDTMSGQSSQPLCRVTGSGERHGLAAQVTTTTLTWIAKFV